MTVHRWSSKDLLERDVVFVVGRSLRVRRRVLGENWGVVWFAWGKPEDVLSESDEAASL